MFNHTIYTLNTKLDRAEMRNDILQSYVQALDYEGKSHIHIKGPETRKIVYFPNDKLFDLIEWKDLLETKRNDFHNKINSAPITKRTDIYLKELNNKSFDNIPGEMWTIESLSYHLANNGENISINQIIEDYETSYPNSNLFNSNLEHATIRGFNLTFYFIDLYTVLQSIANGISQAFYIDYLKGLDKEQFTEKVNTGTISKVKNENINLQWIDSKTDLVELIKALYLSKRIQLEGKPIQQNELKTTFEKLFNIDLKNFHDLWKSSTTSNKKTLDKDFFTSKLYKLVKDESERNKND